MAGGSLIGALRITLGLDSAQFEAGTKRARGVAQRDATAIQKSLSGIKGALNGLITAATVTALVAAGKRALDYAGSLGEVSQQLGITTRDLQVYRFIASQVGIEQDAMDTSLAKLTKSMGEADNGSKKQATAFRELGVSVKDVNGNLLTAGDVMPRLADAFAKVKDPITRARLETELFGKSGQKLDTLLAGGSAAINDMASEAERLGLIMGDSLIKKADDASDRLAVLTKVLEVQVAKAVAENADGILAMADAFIGLVGAIGTAISGLQRFVLSSKQAFRTLKGWDILGRPVDSESARKARLDYFYGTLEQDELAGRGASMNNVRLPKPLAQGALPSPSGGGGKHRKGPKDRSADYLERFNRELAGLEDDQLRLQQDITTDIHEKARLEHVRLETAQAAYDQEIDAKQKAGELTAIQAQTLKNAYALNVAKEHTLVNWKLDDQLVEQELSITRANVENARTLLQGQLAEARTQVERRRIQLAILDNEQKLERATLEAVKAKHDSTDIEYQNAEAKLKQLDLERGQRAGAIRRDTMGPMEAYLDSLPRTADELKEKFESIKVDALNRSLDLASQNILKLKGAAGDLFNQLISDVIRLNLQQALTGGGSGILGSIGKFLGIAAGPATGKNAWASGVTGGGLGLPKLARGGVIGGLPGVDRNVLAINGIPRAMVSANENIHVTPANDRGQQPIFISFTGEESSMLVPRVTGIAGNASLQTFAEGSRASYRRGRQRLA